MMISWVAPVNPSHPYLENDPAPSFDRNICAFHLGFSLDPQQFKEQLIETFCGTHSQLRDAFIEGMGRWLGEHS